MERTGQNFFVSELLGTTELDLNSGTIFTFENNAPSIDFEDFNGEEIQNFDLLLDEESSNGQGGTNAHDHEVSLDDYGMDLERVIVEEDTQSVPEFVSNDDIVGNRPDPEWDIMSMLDDNSTTSIDAENSNCADFGFQCDQLWLGEERSNQSTEAQKQDMTYIDFGRDLERMLGREHRPRLSEADANEMQTTEIGVPEPAVGVPRPVVPPTESIGVTYHSKNKQWEAHLWLKNQQLRNNRKKKGVQLFVGNFPTLDEAKQAHDRAAIKLGIRETSRGKAYPLNFPEFTHADYIAEHVGWSSRDFLWKLRRSSAKFNKGKSRMKGVSVRKGKKGSVLYEAKISQTSSEGEKVTFPLGKFESEDDAGKAYDRALLFLKGVEEFTSVTNFRPSGYSADEIAEAGSSLLSE